MHIREQKNITCTSEHLSVFEENDHCGTLTLMSWALMSDGTLTPDLRKSLRWRRTEGLIHGQVISGWQRWGRTGNWGGGMGSSLSGGATPSCFNKGTISQLHAKIYAFPCLIYFSLKHIQLEEIIGQNLLFWRALFSSVWALLKILTIILFQTSYWSVLFRMAGGADYMAASRGLIADSSDGFSVIPSVPWQMDDCSRVPCFSNTLADHEWLYLCSTDHPSWVIPGKYLLDKPLMFRAAVMW